MGIWKRFQRLPWWGRWPLKWLIVAAALFLVCYPNPRLFFRHLQHWREPNAMIETELPELQPLLDELRTRWNPELPPPQALRTVERFVYEKIEYEWDWVTWGCSDYLPTLSETLAQGREDCDGRAVVAASLLRSLGYQAELVSDLEHVWVKTDQGETMSPGGPKTVEATEKGLIIHWRQLVHSPRSLAYGLAVFPCKRELIVLLVMWLMLLGVRPRWPGSLLLLAVMVDGLLFLRLGGEYHDKPILWAQWIGLGHLVLATLVMMALERKSRSSETRELLKSRRFR